MSLLRAHPACEFGNAQCTRRQGSDLAGVPEPRTRGSNTAKVDNQDVCVDQKHQAICHIWARLASGIAPLPVRRAFAELED